MKHRKLRRLALAGIVVAVAVAAVSFIDGGPSGPAYGGKSASQWLDLYRGSSLTEREDAFDAFKALGDEAVPYLLSVSVRTRRPFLVRSYEKWWSKLPSPFRRILPRVSSEATEGQTALKLLRATRPSARTLMPRLDPWLSSPENERYLLALDLLGAVGDGGSEAVPFLVEALKSTNQYHRIFAVQSLLNLGGEARAAVPALMAALDDAATRYRAIRALRNIGPEARAAIPRLESLLDTVNRSQSLAVAAALHNINPEGNRLRLLIEAAGEPRLRAAAINELGELGPVAAPALETVLEALRTEQGVNRIGAPEWLSIAEALRRISPTNRAVIPSLLEKLKVAKGLDRLNIGACLVRFDPAEPHGLEVMTEFLRSAPGSADFAAYILRQAGPSARAAIPALKAALNAKDETVRRAAASALRKIEPTSAVPPR